MRGPGGGYSLGRGADEIYVGEVISAVDENIDTTRCNGAHNCQNNERCLTHDLWSDLSNQIYGYLNKISLQDLMDRQAVREVADRQDHPDEDQSGLDISLVDGSGDMAGA